MKNLKNIIPGVIDNSIPQHELDIAYKYSNIFNSIHDELYIKIRIIMIIFESL